MAKKLAEQIKGCIKNELDAPHKNCEEMKTEMKNTLLLKAVETDNRNYAKQLIAAGYEVNLKNPNPPLARAIEKGYLEIVKILLDAGAILDHTYFKDSLGPLHIAAMDGWPKIVKLLIDIGANVNACDKYLFTPLHLASERQFEEKANEYCEIIEMLIRAGADMSAKNYEQKTPLCSSIRFDFPAAFELMLSMGATIDTDKSYHYLSLSIFGESFDIFERLVELGCDPKSVDSSGETLLHLAASLSRSKIVKYLLDNGLTTDLLTKQRGFDPLCEALEHWPNEFGNVFQSLNDDHDKDLEEGDQYERFIEQMKCFDLLIDYGADVNRVTKDQLTPLYIVLKNFRQHSNVVRLLLRNGAKFDFENYLVSDMMVYSDGSKFPYLLVRHAAMFEAQNRSDGPANFNLDKLDGELRKDYACFRDELELMKTKKIGDSDVTFFDLLVNRDISSYVRNESIRSAFEASDIKKQFPVYSDVLADRFSKEIEFQGLANKAMGGLSCILNWEENSMHLVLNQILRYLDKKDLFNLALIFDKLHDKNIG